MGNNVSRKVMSFVCCPRATTCAMLITRAVKRVKIFTGHFLPKSGSDGGMRSRSVEPVGRLTNFPATTYPRPKCNDGWVKSCHEYTKSLSVTKERRVETPSLTVS